MAAHFACYFAAGATLRLCTRSCGSALRALGRTSRSAFVLETCDLSAGAAGAHFASYFCNESLQISSRSCGSAHPVLLLHFNVAILQPEPRPRHARTISVEGSARSRHIRVAPHESTSTRTISAEGSLSSRHSRTAPHRELFGTPDLRRGFAKLETQSRGGTARALQHAPSMRRIRTAPQQERFDTHNLRRALLGSPSSRHIRTASQRERVDAHLRRGFTEHETDSHGARARALRHARSPQDKFARCHSESDLTRHSESDLTRATSPPNPFLWSGWLDKELGN